ARTGENYIIGEHGTVRQFVKGEERLRSVATVATPEGPKAFYRSTGKGTPGSGGAHAGDWVPFEGFSRGGKPAYYRIVDDGIPIDIPIDAAESLAQQKLGVHEGWIVKDRISSGLAEGDPMFKWGTQANKDIAMWLNGRVGQSPVIRPWQTIQIEI